MNSDLTNPCLFWRDFHHFCPSAHLAMDVYGQFSQCQYHLSNLRDLEFQNMHVKAHKNKSNLKKNKTNLYKTLIRRKCWDCHFWNSPHHSYKTFAYKYPLSKSGHAGSVNGNCISHHSASHKILSDTFPCWASEPCEGTL